MTETKEERRQRYLNTINKSMYIAGGQWTGILAAAVHDLQEKAKRSKNRVRVSKVGLLRALLLRALEDGILDMAPDDFTEWYAMTKRELWLR